MTPILDVWILARIGKYIGQFIYLGTIQKNFVFASKPTSLRLFLSGRNEKMSLQLSPLIFGETQRFLLGEAIGLSNNIYDT